MITSGRGRRMLSTSALIGSLLVGAGLVGCATNVAADEPPQAAPIESPTPGPVSGIGSTEPYPGIVFPIPRDARSVVVAFTCTGDGPFSVELGDSMMLGQAPLSGTCSGPQEFSWPITEQTGETLYVSVDRDAEWTATPVFATDDFAQDAGVAVDCGALTDFFSSLVNADQGLTMYDAFDESEWAARVDAAADRLDDIAARSEVGASFNALSAIARDPARVPGDIVPRTDELRAQVAPVCAANHTEIVTIAEFGG